MLQPYRYYGSSCLESEFTIRSEFQRTFTHSIELDNIILFFTIDFLLIKEVGRHFFHIQFHQLRMFEAIKFDGNVGEIGSKFY